MAEIHPFSGLFTNRDMPIDFSRFILYIRIVGVNGQQFLLMASPRFDLTVGRGDFTLLQIPPCNFFI